MRLSCGAWLIGVVMLGSATAHSASRLLLQGFSGIDDSAVREQLEASVCRGLACVSIEGGAGALPTDVAVLQAQTEKGKQFTSILLALVTPQEKPRKWRLTIRRGRLTDSVLQGVVAKIQAAVAQVQASAPAKQDLMSGVPAPGAKPSGKDLMSGVPAPVRVQTPEDSASDSVPNPAPPFPVKAPSRSPWIALELGTGIFNRDLRFFGKSTTGTLRDYDGRLLLAPYVRGSVYPLAGVSQPWLKPLGLHLDFQRGIGGTFELPNGAAHPMIYQRLDVEMVWPIPVGGGVSVGPDVGYRTGRFLLGLASDGSPLANLPGVSENGVYLGVNAAWTLAHQRQLSLWASGHFQPDVRLGELARATYFPRAKAYGLEAKLGVSFLLAGPVHAVIGGTFTRISATLNPEPTAARIARGAADRFVSLRLGLRASF